MSPEVVQAPTAWDKSDRKVLRRAFDPLRSVTFRPLSGWLFSPEVTGLMCCSKEEIFDRATGLIGNINIMSALLLSCIAGEAFGPNDVDSMDESEQTLGNVYNVVTAIAVALQTMIVMASTYTLFILYSVGSTPAVAESAKSAAVELKVSGGVRDRAQVFLDGQEVGTMLRTVHDRTGASSLTMPTGSVFQEGGQRLSLLVENMGRINYGEGTWDAKGIGVKTGDTVHFAGQELVGAGVDKGTPVPLGSADTGLWEVRTLPLKPEQVRSLPFTARTPGVWKHRRREGPGSSGNGDQRRTAAPKPVGFCRCQDSPRLPRRPSHLPGRTQR